MLKLDVGALPTKVKAEQVHVKRPAWYKATHEHCEAYKLSMERKIEAMTVLTV